MSDSFLTDDDVTALTGIKRGEHGKTRHQLQADWCRSAGIAFRINARGRVIITWQAINGNPKEKLTQQWTPAALRIAA
jgi:hypothetical protein